MGATGRFVSLNLTSFLRRLALCGLPKCPARVWQIQMHTAWFALGRPHSRIKCTWRRLNFQYPDYIHCTWLHQSVEVSSAVHGPGQRPYVCNVLCHHRFASSTRFRRTRTHMNDKIWGKLLKVFGAVIIYFLFELKSVMKDCIKKFSSKMCANKAARSRGCRQCSAIRSSSGTTNEI